MKLGAPEIWLGGWLPVGLLFGAALVVGQPAVGQSAVVESFESLEGWSTHASQNAHVELALDEGVSGKALRVDFEIQPGGSFVIIRKAVRLKLPKNYAFKVWIRGQGPPNDLQFKLIDPADRNVWWYRQRPCHFPAEWRQLTIRDVRVEFAWGDSPVAQPSEVGFIEFAIAAGSGGRGSLWLDELTWEPRKPPKGRVPKPRVEASTSAPGNPPEYAADTDPHTAWRSGVLQAAQWLQVDFQTPQEYGAIVIDWDALDYAVVYRVLASTDGEHWWTLFASEHGNGGRDYIPTGEAESRWIRVEMERSSRGQGYAIRSFAIKPYELAASPNAFFATLAAEAPSGLYPRYFVPEQVYWTSVAPPEGGRQALLSSDGAIEPVAGGYSIEPFVYRNGTLLSWRQVRSVPEVANAAVPIPRVVWEHEWFRLEVELAAGGGGRGQAFYARYRLESRVADPAEFTLFLAVRPFQVLPPWQNLNLVGGVSAIRTLAFDSRTIWVDRKPAIVVQTPGARFGAAYFEEGMVTESLLRGTLPSHSEVMDPLGYGSGALEYKFTLAPGGSAAVYLAMPWRAEDVAELRIATDGAEAAYQRQFEQAEHDWQRVLGRVQFDLPPTAQEIEATLRAALAHILMHRSGPALQPGPRTYARAWIRDGVTMASALLQLGVVSEARSFAQWFAQYQLPDGRIPCCVDWRGADPVPEHDSNGQFLFLVAEYYRFTRDVGLVAELWPHIRAAVEWIERARAQRMTSEYQSGDKRLFYGLLPESISHEGYAARPVHSYWDDLWALRGIDDASRLAAVVGENELAARWALLRDGFRSTLVTSMVAVAARHKLEYLPASVELADFDPNSTAIALYPVDVASALPRELVEKTFDRYWQVFQQRVQGVEPWDSFTPYELRNVPAFLRLGKREQAWGLLESLLRDRRPLAWRQWPEIVWRDPQWPRFIGDMPHAWVSALFIEAVRHLFAYERGSDAALVVGAGIPRDWVEAGVGVRRLPTHYGILHFRAEAVDGGHWKVRIGGDLQMPPGRVVLQLPVPPPLREARVNGRAIADLDPKEVRIGELPAEVDLVLAEEGS
ncbi:MAG: discoidin domain-containing protein [Candidatus Binatia bacterium]|nr:discoidin domain-containing protein [Candidatus Binatia bacterium]